MFFVGNLFLKSFLLFHPLITSVSHNLTDSTPHFLITHYHLFLLLSCAWPSCTLLRAVRLCGPESIRGGCEYTRALLASHGVSLARPPDISRSGASRDLGAPAVDSQSLAGAATGDSTATADIATTSGGGGGASDDFRASEDGGAGAFLAFMASEPMGILARATLGREKPPPPLWTSPEAEAHAHHLQGLFLALQTGAAQGAGSSGVTPPLPCATRKPPLQDDDSGDDDDDDDGDDDESGGGGSKVLSAGSPRDRRRYRFKVFFTLVPKTGSSSATLSLLADKCLSRALHIRSHGHGCPDPGACSGLCVPLLPGTGTGSSNGSGSNLGRKASAVGWVESVVVVREPCDRFASVVAHMQRVLPSLVPPTPVPWGDAVEVTTQRHRLFV